MSEKQAKQEDKVEFQEPKTESPANEAMEAKIKPEVYEPPVFPKQNLPEYQYDSNKIIDGIRPEATAEGAAYERELENARLEMEARAIVKPPPELLPPQPPPPKLDDYFVKPLEAAAPAPEPEPEMPKPIPEPKTIPIKYAEYIPPYISNTWDRYLVETFEGGVPQFTPKPVQREEERGWALFNHQSGTKIKVVFVIIICILAIGFVLTLLWFIKELYFDKNINIPVK